MCSNDRHRKIHEPHRLKKIHKIRKIIDLMSAYITAKFFISLNYKHTKRTMNIVRQAPLRSRLVLSSARYYATSKPGPEIEKTEINSPTVEKKLSPEQAKAAAAQLAIQSLKDMGSMLSSSSDEAVQPIDTRPIFKDPSKFGSLSLLHQGQVLKELQEKFDKKWVKLTDEDKKLGYYIAYGDWGARSDFTNWSTCEAPLDLPFVVPSTAKTSQSPKDVVKKLEAVILAETSVRKSQFDTSKMDPVTKVFIFLTILVAMAAIARDKNTGEAGKPLEIIVEDHYARKREQMQKEKERLEEVRKQVEEANRRKWYYLWLR